MMFVEVLFWRTPADCVDLAEGYGSLQMQRCGHAVFTYVILYEDTIAKVPLIGLQWILDSLA